MSSQSALRSYSSGQTSMRVQRELDVELRRVYSVARRVIGHASRGAGEWRAKLIDAFENNKPREPRWNQIEVGRCDIGWEALKRGRALLPESVAPDLYEARFEELELELAMLRALGDRKRIRPISARRYGTGQELVTIDGDEHQLDHVARSLLASTERQDEARTLPARSKQGRSLEALMHGVAVAAGMEVRVVVDAGLVARAAVGDRTVFLADAMFGEREGRRLAAHEVLGHLVAAFNGRNQPLGIFGVGTARSFRDQEGLAICLEELAGLMDGTRVRTLCARVLATAALHRGASFVDVVRLLLQDHDFRIPEAVAIAERTFRAGGLARDAVYLHGWLRVRHALSDATATIDQLRVGKVGLDDLALIDQLADAGFARQPVLRPSLAKSLGTTGAGTNRDTSPPSRATSFTRFEAT